MDQGAEHAASSSAPYQPGWHADPFGRHEFRYHNGSAWTGDVADRGERSVDPPVWSSTGPATGERSAVVSLVFGVIGVCLAWMPFLVAVGAVASIGALVLARRAGRRVRSPRRVGQARAARILGVAGVVLVLPGILLTRVALDVLRPGPHRVEITSCDAAAGRAVVQGSVTNLSGDERGYLLLVRFSRAGTGGVIADEMVQVEDVPAGGSTDFAASVATEVTDVECDVLDVLGGLPLAID